MGAAAAVEAPVDKPLVVPNFSCRRRTSRGGLATEFTNAIFTCRPAGGTNAVASVTAAGEEGHPERHAVLLPPTFWLVGVRGGDVLGEQPQPLLALVVQPQIHLPPRLVLLRRLSLEVPLAVTHPQLVGLLREPLKDQGSTK